MLTPQQILELLQAYGVRPDQLSMLMAYSQGNLPVPGNGAIPDYISNTGADGLVGQSITLTPNSPNQSIMMPVGNRSSGNPGLTVTLSIDDVEYAPGTSFYRNSVVGKIDFGAGGGGHRVEVDIKQGTQISLVGQAPSISATLEEPTLDGTPSKVIISASIGIGSRAARAFNTRTLPPRAVATELTLYVKVPNFAYSFMPFCDDPNALVPGATTIEFWSYAGPCAYVAAGTYTGVPPIALTGMRVASFSGTEFAGSRLSEGMKLSQGADLITITNHLATTVNWTPCFGLSI